MKLILVRHGQSQWNLENRFTGWENPGLTEKGVEEAKNTGIFLKDERIDEAFTSDLSRAQRTLDLILEEAGKTGIPITRNQALNERDYGDLTGKNKEELAKEVGEEQVLIWRRSYDVRPPGGESLKDTIERVIPYFKENIMPRLKEGKNILISAHGNSLRSMVMYLEDLSPEEILKREIATGEPVIYTFDKDMKAHRVEL